MDFQVHLNGFSSAPEESSGSSGRSWTVHWCITAKVRTVVVHKGAEEEYVVIQVQPHPSIIPQHDYASWSGAGKGYVVKKSVAAG